MAVVITTRNGRHRWTTLAVPAVALTVLLAGCGDGDEPAIETDTEELATPSEDEADEVAPDEETTDVEDADAAAEPNTVDAAPDEDAPAAAEVDEPADDGFGGVELTLEMVTVVTWEEHEDAFKYEIIVDGEEQGSTLSPPYVLLEEDVPADAVTVEAQEIGDAPLGEVDATIEAEERYVVRWAEEEVANAYVGVAAAGFGRASSAAHSPFVVEPSPEDVEAVLFGPGYTREEQDEEGVTVTTGAPFEWTGDGHTELAPYVELPLD